MIAAQQTDPDGTPSADDGFVDRAASRARWLLAHDAEVARSAVSDAALVALGCATSSIELVARACELYADRPAIAHRPPGEASFLSTTYAGLWKSVTTLASAWHREGIVRAGAIVPVVAFGGPDFIAAELALLYLGATFVPLPTSVTPATFRSVLHQTRARAVVCDEEGLRVLVEVLPECALVRTVTVITADGDGARVEARVAQGREAANAPGVVFTTASALRAAASAPLVPVHVAGAGSDPLRAIVYTSGSTGEPRGACFPESVYVQKWLPSRARGYPFLPDFPVALPLTFIFTPLSHQMGAEVAAAAWMRGALTYLAVGGDVSRLFEDIRAARPTYVALVPRVANRIHEHYEREVAQRSHGACTTAARERIRRDTLDEMGQHYLGDRLVAATSGSAPISIPVLTFLRECFRVPVCNMMGMTEVGGFALDDCIRRDNVIDFRLVDVPDKGFSTRDQPFPRGELWLRTRRQVHGYYQSEDATRATFTDDGFVRTGDIFELRGGGALSWVARKGQVLKLAHGKFVNLAQLEEIFSGSCKLVRQAYLHATSDRSFLVAVLVPDLGAIRDRVGADVSPGDARVRSLLRDDLARAARDHALAPYEVPREFVVEAIPFTRENGFAADNGKLLRARVQEAYAARLDELYEHVETVRAERTASLYALPKSATAAAKVTAAVSAVLGIALEGEAALASTFGQLGGDSLNAVTLAEMLETELGMRLPVASILQGRATLEDLARAAQACAADTRAGATPQRLHGDAAVLRADDVRLGRLFSSSELQAGAPGDRSEDVRHTGPQTVLVTGASGFAGRFVVLDLLSRSRSQIAQVVGLVRARDDRHAGQRMRASLECDPALVERFDTLAEAGVFRVVAGDVSGAQLGLPGDLYEDFASAVDVVIHAGALVNHALRYDDLYEPNVLGTAEVLRFALSTRNKRVTFISTAGLAEGLARTHPVREEEGAAELWPTRPRHGSAAGQGYSTSKWAAELLCADARSRFGLPVDILRCVNLMAHPVYRGQINAGDFLSRLLLGLAYTGVAPRSFYEDAGTTPFLDGVPVSFAAEAIVDLALRRTATGSTFHLAGSAGAAAVSLDSLVDCLQAYGVPMRTVSDYDAWYAEFRERLRALDTSSLRQSPLTIVSRWERPTRVGTRLDTACLRATLRALRMDPSFDPPPVTREMVFKCLDDLRYLGALRRTP